MLLLSTPENFTRSVWLSLVGPSLAIHLAPNRMDALAQGIRDMLTRDMLITREGEEIVCTKGTVCGRITRRQRPDR